MYEQFIYIIFFTLTLFRQFIPSPPTLFQSMTPSSCIIIATPMQV